MPLSTGADESENQYTTGPCDLWELDVHQKLIDSDEHLESLFVSVDVYGIDQNERFVTTIINVTRRHQDTNIWIAVKAKYMLILSFPADKQYFDERFYKTIVYTNVWFRFCDAFAFLCSQADVRASALPKSPEIEVVISKPHVQNA